MAMHYKNFREELYREHLEEAAFQYETRLNWLTDAEIGWQDLQDIDLQLEAHLDALIIGGALALKICIEALPEAEAPILHVVVRVFCRHRLIDRFAKLWSDFDFSDNDKVRSVADALKWDCPEGWFDSLLKVFSSPKKEMFPLLAPSVAFRSSQSGAALLAALARAEEAQVADLIWAVAHCKNASTSHAIAVLAPYLQHSDIRVVQQAAIALMIFGECRTLSICSKHIDKLPLVFSLGGNVAQCQPIFQRAQQGLANESCLLALGILGDLAAVPHLLNYLKHPDLANIAARSLQLISGASLYENVHEADVVDENELFDFEIDAFKKGELPKNIDGNPFGIEVKKLTVDSEKWMSWFNENKSSFIRGKRYRDGQLYSARQLLNNLVDNQTPYDLRCIVHQELLIRYAIDLPFFADDLIVNQQKQLNDIHFWIEKSGTLFPEGSWMFFGQEV